MYVNHHRGFLVLVYLLGTLHILGQNHSIDHLNNFEYKNLLKESTTENLSFQEKKIVQYIAYSQLGHIGKATTAIEEIQDDDLNYFSLIKNLRNDTLLLPIRAIDKDSLSNAIQFHLLVLLFQKNLIDVEQFIDASNILRKDDHAQFIVKYRRLHKTNAANRGSRYDQAKEIIQIGKDKDWTNNYKYILALTHFARMTKNSEISQNFFEEALRLSYETCQDCWANIHHSKVLSLFAAHYRRQKKKDLAIEYFERSLDIKKKHAAYNNNAFTDRAHLTYMVMGQIYYDNKEYPQAITLYNKALDVLNQTVDHNSKLYHQRHLFYNNCIALIEHRKGLTDKALEHVMPLYDKLIEEEADDFIWLPEVLNALSKYLSKSGDIKGAYDFYRKSISRLNANYLESYDQCDDYTQLTSTLFDMSKKIMPLSTLNERIAHNTYTLHLLAYLCNYYKDYGRLNKILRSSNRWFDAEIASFVHLVNAQNADDKLIDHLLLLSNQAKHISFFVNQSVERSKDQSTLKVEIDALKKELLSSYSEEKKKELQKLQFQYDLNEDYQELDSIKTPTQLSQKIRKRLHPQQMYLEVTELKHDYLVIQFDNSRFRLKLIPNSTALNEEILDFKKSIYSPFLTCDNQEINRDSLSRKQDMLSKRIAHALFSEVDLTHVNEIFINPDSKFCEVPFDVLKPYDDNKFLLESCNINLIQSIDQINNEHVASIKKITAFGPAFSNQQEELCVAEDYRKYYLGPLNHNQNEVSSIASFFKTESYLGAEATLDNFTQSLAEADFIHLATHSKVDASNKDYSFVAFTPTLSSEEHKMYLLDFENQSNQAECIVLSSCESAVGEYIPGSGINGIAQTLLGNGAQSVISSLWSVNDQSTSILMFNFYYFLNQGFSKSESLRRAKLKYIEEAEPKYQDPFYWAGFQAQGNMRAIKVKQVAGFPKWALCILGFFVLIGILIRSSKFKT